LSRGLLSQWPSVLWPFVCGLLSGGLLFRGLVCTPAQTGRFTFWFLLRHGASLVRHCPVLQCLVLHFQRPPPALWHESSVCHLSVVCQCAQFVLKFWRKKSRGSRWSCKWNGRGMKKLAFDQYLSVCFENGARYGHSCYRRRIGNRTQAFESYHFQWHWTTPNPDFKVTPIFDAEYVINGRPTR